MLVVPRATVSFIGLYVKNICFWWKNFWFLTKRIFLLTRISIRWYLRECYEIKFSFCLDPFLRISKFIWRIEAANPSNIFSRRTVLGVPILTALSESNRSAGISRRCGVCTDDDHFDRTRCSGVLFYIHEMHFEQVSWSLFSSHRFFTKPDSDSGNRQKASFISWIIFRSIFSALPDR